MRYLLVFILILTFVFSSCAQSNSENTMSITELQQKISGNDTIIVLDVRNPEELIGSLGKINGVINIPVQDLEDRINELDDFKDKEIAVICRTGRRSSTATDLLISKGFKAKNVLGGMVEYRESEK